MSPLAAALAARFENVCLTELTRLQRKTAALSAAERAEIDAISITVARAIAAHLVTGLDGDTSPDLCNIIGHLFKVGPAAGAEDASPQAV